jgi:hypothetical protein
LGENLEKWKTRKMTSDEVIVDTNNSRTALGIHYALISHHFSVFLFSEVSDQSGSEWATLKRTGAHMNLISPMGPFCTPPSTIIYKMKEL